MVARRLTQRVFFERTFMKTIKLFLLITLAIYLTGCSESLSQSTNPGASETTSKDSIDPCSLLTREEIGATLGQQVTQANLRSSPRPNCNYTVGDGSVTVFVFNDPSAAGAFHTGRRMQDLQTEPVTGVGDQAYWSPGIKTLNVVKGQVYFTVQFYAISSGSRETMISLARNAVTRLP